MKRHIDESNEKWRRGMNEEIGNMKAEIQQIKTDMEEWKSREGNQTRIDEGLRKEVMELKKWREEMVIKEKKEGEEAIPQTDAGTAKGNRQEQRNWKELEWITEEKKREKRKKNLIIVGLEGSKRYSSEDIGNWLKKEIEVEAKIVKVWRVRTNTGKFLLGAQCGSESDKREVIVNKKNLGDKEIYIENDLTWQETKIREKPWEKATELKEEGI